MAKLPPWPDVWKSIRALRPAILDDCDLTPNSDGWVSIHCPLHSDDSPSLRVNIEEGGVKCMAGCDGLRNLNDLEDIIIDKASMSRRGRRPKDVVGDLAQRRLLPRDWLIDVFGIEPGPGGYSIPIDDPEVDPDIEIDYEIDGIKKRQRHWLIKRGEWIDSKATTRPKYHWNPNLSESGVKVQNLVYNLERIRDKLPKERLVYVCAGAPDVWVMQRAGFPAISFLAGEGNVPTARAIDKVIQAGIKEAILIYDRDQAGDEGAEKTAVELAQSGIAVTILRLPEDLGKGGDLSDLWKRVEGDADEFERTLSNCEARFWQADDVMARERKAVTKRKKDKEHTLPEECWVEPFLSYREAVRRSTSACDEYHFFALMNVLGALFGRRAWVEYGRKLFPNQYTVLVGPTHTFKSTANSRAIEMIETLYEKDWESQTVEPLPGTPLHVEEAAGSAEGLIEAAAFADTESDDIMKVKSAMGWVSKDDKGEKYDEEDLAEWKERRLLIRQDEFTKMLSKAKQGGGGSGFIPHLLTAFDCPKEIRLRTRTRPVVLINVVVSILSDSTAEYLGRYFDELEWTSGFGNRIIFVDGRPREVLPKPSAPEPKAWERAAEHIREAFVAVAGELGNTYNTEYMLSPKAEERWDQLYREWMAEREEGYDPEQAAATERHGDYALKFALIYALMAADGKPVISAEDIELGWKAARYAEQVTFDVLGTLVEDKQARWQKAIEDYIRENEPIKRRDLQQRFSRIPVTTFAQILKSMEEMGVIKNLSDGYHLAS